MVVKSKLEDLQSTRALGRKMTRVESRTAGGVFSICDMLLLLFKFSVLAANPRKVNYTVADPARGLLKRENITKMGIMAPPPPPPPPDAARTEEMK